MKPRILIFSVAYEPLVGGAEVAVRNLTDRLFNYDFDLVTWRFKSTAKAVEQIGKVNVYRVGFGTRLGRYLYPVLAFRLARRLHQEHPYKLVWAIMAAYAGAAALLFLRRYPKVKFLLTLQEGDSIAHIHHRVSGFKRQWQKIFQRADFIQTISYYLVQWARQEGATCPIGVVPNGVDIGKFKIRPPRRTRIKIKTDKPIIITTSRLVYKNGVDILIAAGAELQNLWPDCDFEIWILGVGPEEAKLKRLVSKLHLENRVRFLGIIPAAELPSYLQQACVFARPSRSEGLGNAFLEAMAVGLPVVGTAVGGIPEFLVDGETGLFCRSEDPRDLAEKFQRLLRDQELRERLGVSAQTLVRERFDWQKITGQMADIFKQLLI